MADFRTVNRAAFPDFHNGPVPSFGPADARLLIVGLAPGLKGANQTGRPFTGDYAGDLLYDTLLRFGFARGCYGRHAADGLRLNDCRITNAVRCVPPQNKPVGAEVRQCRPFLQSELDYLPPRAVLALGRIAHDGVLAALGLRPAAFGFGHGACHRLPPRQGQEDGMVLFSSYHCSRYNTNTGRLTPAMFDAVFAAIRDHLDGLATRP